MSQLTRRTVLRFAAFCAAVPFGAILARADSHVTNHVVVIKNMRFSPADLTIKAGDTVTWRNEDDTAHSAWDLNDVFDTGLLLPGQSAALTFSAAGTFSYRCRPHRSMRGTITITR